VTEDVPEEVTVPSTGWRRIPWSTRIAWLVAVPIVAVIAYQFQKPQFLSPLSLVSDLTISAIFLIPWLYAENLAPRSITVSRQGVLFKHLLKEVFVPWDDLSPARIRDVPSWGRMAMVAFVAGPEDRSWPRYFWVTRAQATAILGTMPAAANSRPQTGTVGV
jgi:hypothetical protein